MAELPELPRCAYSLHIHAAAHIQDFYTADQMREYAITALRTALEAPAAQKVEPTDCGCATQLDCDGRCCMKAAPAAREPLTDEQIRDAVQEADLDWHQGWTLDEAEPNRFVQFARAIEQAHGIKEQK